MTLYILELSNKGGPVEHYRQIGRRSPCTSYTHPPHTAVATAQPACSLLSFSPIHAIHFNPFRTPCPPLRPFYRNGAYCKASTHSTRGAKKRILTLRYTRVHTKHGSNALLKCPSTSQDWSVRLTYAGLFLVELLCRKIGG